MFGIGGVLRALHLPQIQGGTIDDRRWRLKPSVSISIEDVASEEKCQSIAPILEIASARVENNDTQCFVIHSCLAVDRSLKKAKSEFLQA